MDQLRIQTRILPSLLLLVACLVPAPSQAQVDQLVVHHDLRVTLDPLSNGLTVEDTITLPDALAGGAISFLLNDSLAITDSSVRLSLVGSGNSSIAAGINSSGADTATSNRYTLVMPRGGDNRFRVTYGGRIFQPARLASPQYSQGFSETSGIIEDLGVYLNGASLWVPNFGTGLLTFDLQVEFAPGTADWTAISQGTAAGQNRWTETNPMEEVYLIAARFTEYSARYDGVDLLVYLRDPDPNLATRYLDATERYLALYEPLLGDYPFAKFALVENFWETGYGMPSFTLLGSQIIRFPFIIDSSYPHEILHNWWGNGVYPDYDTGNWSEGLTAYLADHLFQEMNGLGPEYRKDNLIRYRNYVADTTDFPLNAFTARNSAASQAVGYGKTMMLWHMLRLELGDGLFLEGLRRLYADHKFHRVGFDQIALLFSELAQRDLSPFFDQWVNRTGAPRLQLSVEKNLDGRARIMFTQLQAGEAYALTVPIALYYAGEESPRIYNVSLAQKFQGVMAEDFDRLQAVLVDPYFDLFRQLDRAEIPPVIGQLFGAPRIAFLLPENDRSTWQGLAESFGAGVDAMILGAGEIDELPGDRSVWILGRDNPWSAAIGQGIGGYGARLGAAGLDLGGSAVEFANRSSVLTAVHPADEELALGWIDVDNMAAMPGMIEKLPHYGKYSYLSFVGDEPTNDVKGVWQSPDSPMLWLADNLPAGFQLPALPPVQPLAVLPPRYLPERLQQHVTILADAAMQGREIGTPGADLAASYIADRFAAIGLAAPGGSYLQEWQQQVPGRGAVRLANVVGVLEGSDPALRDRPAVIGAHYDHLGMEGGLHPGADDNASGVSIMLEVAARLARSFTPRRPLVFVAFTGEEAGLLGSTHFVSQPPVPLAPGGFFAMLNLDTVGRLQDRQLQVFGSDSAYEWPFVAQGIGFTIGMTAQMAAQVIASSDHVPFLNAGVPALHLFAGAHGDYHRPSDVPGMLDYAGMSGIAHWLEEAAVFLGDRAEPLRTTLAGARVDVSQAPVTAREASLGTVPDFAHGGAGVRISGVSSGGAAEAAGLQAGDILLRFDGTTLDGLQQYSNLIREAAPGDTVTLRVRRADQEFEVPVTLQAR